MKATIPVSVTSEEAIMLQQVSESGEEDVASLVSTLRMNRRRVMQLLDHLKQKGLVTIKTTYGDWRIRTSAKGARFVHYVWPEMQMSY